MKAEMSMLIAPCKTAYDIAKGISSFRVEGEVKEKTAELLRILLSVQRDALTMQAKYQELLQEKDDLAKKIMEFEDWSKTKDQYELKDLAPGIPAYLRKKGDNSEEPTFWICPYCYKQKKESFLQCVYHFESAGFYFCPACKTEFPWGRIGRGHRILSRAVLMAILDIVRFSFMALAI